MNGQCPLCQAAWPSGAILTHAVCPSCFGGFHLDGGRWTFIPPSPQADEPLPFALHTPLLLRRLECRIAGFASWSYDVEYGRDQYDTYYRHAYALSDGRLLCWAWGHWWLAHPVDSSLVVQQPADRNQVQFDGRQYRRHASQSLAAERACGLLPYPFRWNSSSYFQDFIAGPLGPGAYIVMGNPVASGNYIWVGEFVDPREVLQAFALREFPLNSPYRSQDTPAPAAAAEAAARPSTAAGSPSRSQLPRILGVIAGAVLIIVLIGAGAYLLERRTKVMASQWFACPTEAPQQVEVTRDAGRVELNPHLPQGALHYEVQLVDASGAALAKRADFLDMSDKRRTLSLELPASAAALRISCSLLAPVAGFRSWPVELRFLH